MSSEGSSASRTSEPIRYLSLFSGVEAASLAFEPLGWEPVAFCEVDPFPAAVLAHRWPDVPNLGDIRAVDWAEFKEKYGKPEVIIGGSPCFVAGTIVETEQGYVPIENVRVGDKVVTHKFRYHTVLNVGSHFADVITLVSERGRTITCTPNHPILNERLEWTRADDMLGHKWLYLDHGTWEEVVEIRQCSCGLVEVYNIEVEDDHSYTANGVAVHNCQSFSIAGGRESLDGESRLMFEYVRALSEVKPEWFVWENVPGVLNTRDNAFSQLLREVQDIGYVSLAWRVLDAQLVRVPLRDGDGAIARWVGPVAQRRRRVFLVGHLGAGGVPPRYSLSRTAAQGIIRRASRRGKSLPKMLLDALTAQAQ